VWLFLAFIACMFVGVVFFPHGGVHQVGETYVDRRSVLHTEVEYHWFLVWERAFLGTYGAVLLVLVCWSLPEYYRLTGSLPRFKDKGTEVWLKPPARPDDEWGTT
jgi:hypothetical protein